MEGHRRVLVFDDELVHRLAGAKFPGIELRLEKSADDAENVVAAFRPAIVLMDHNLLGSMRDGEQAVTALRGLWNNDALPIYGISSSPLGNAAMVRAGANGFMAKSAVREFLSAGAPFYSDSAA
jgi:hypothetical protein